MNAELIQLNNRRMHCLIIIYVEEFPVNFKGLGIMYNNISQENRKLVLIYVQIQPKYIKYMMWPEYDFLTQC